MRIGLRILKQVAAWKWRILFVYVCLLILSDFKRWRTSEETIAPDVSLLSVTEFKNDRPTDRKVRLAYAEYQPQNNPEAPVIVLLQGSPGDHRDFQKLGPELAAQYHVIAPDLPGFGSSSHNIADYSNRAHARYVLALLDQLQGGRAHFVGFSMGAGVALNVADIAPERVKSLTMLSGIGVQELELLGNYHLNHSIHAAQLAFLWLIRELVPHFGWLDHSMLDISYARNFYDTDQRPLRSILSHYAGPMLILHGSKDIMVPIEAARETHRLVPQSEMVLFPNESHFYVFARPERQAALAMDFFERVEKGEAATKAEADPLRVAQASAPFDAASIVPRAMGPTALVLFSLLGLATLITEDLTCVWAGVLAAEGRVSFKFAVIACLSGIVVGDILLFLAGRLIGRTLLRYPPLSWLVRTADVERSSRWFQRRGMWAILLSRFLPGTRLPTYFAAGLLDTSFLKFGFYFLIAAAAWTPLLVGASMVLGREFIEFTLIPQESLFLRVAVTALAIFVIVRLLMRLGTFRGRRLLLARWRRLVHWEFWPPWAFYPPVVLYIFYLGVRYRSLTLFTAANPGIEEGGFIGESKSKILKALACGKEVHPLIASSMLIKKVLESEVRVDRALEFMRKHSLSFPVTLKPDTGERGSGVAIVRSNEELEGYLRAATTDVIVQEYIAGLEFGIFYYRYPDRERGQIFSITRKLFPSVVGDGVCTLEKLILKDNRAVCLAQVYFDAQRVRLWDIPRAEEVVQLIEIGTHCRGSVFLDGKEIQTEALEAAIDRLARGFTGFYFGRFDIRADSLAALQEGLSFKVIELNGVTSEATHIYDPRNSLLTAYSVLCEQWRLAFEIGFQNGKLGARPASLRRLAGLIIENWHERAERSDANLRPIPREVDSASEFAHEL
ncbi:MAG TPA: alpha/beta fold hydrolase [Pyrinomonadaceae bacterium]|nr:alpha/beta fold hydrolase [Pyrinomonadaceae bacterium]